MRYHKILIRWFLKIQPYFIVPLYIVPIEKKYFFMDLKYKYILINFILFNEITR